MNKILVDKENIELKKITNKIDVTTILKKDIFGINRIIINVLKSTELQIKYELDNIKMDIVINVAPNVEFRLYEYKKGDKCKIQYTYNIEDNSNIYVYKFNCAKNIKEMIITNLNGSNSKFDYTLKSISTTKEVYDIVVSHNKFNSASEIKNNVVNIKDGKALIQVSSYVDNKIKKCIVNQKNHIINLSNNKCEIRPNLYINEYDTVANHSALIGGFSPEELFFLQSRGIDIQSATKLLIKGFLLSDLNNNNLIKLINKNINEYWR